MVEKQVSPSVRKWNWISCFLLLLSFLIFLFGGGFNWWWVARARFKNIHPTEWKNQTWRYKRKKRKEKKRKKKKLKKEGKRKDVHEILKKGKKIQTFSFDTIICIHAEASDYYSLVLFLLKFIYSIELKNIIRHNGTTGIHRRITFETNRYSLIDWHISTNIWWNVIHLLSHHLSHSSESSLQLDSL